MEHPTVTDDLEAGPAATPIRRLVGVYAADGTLRGEISYWIGARLGRAHCALCDITHGLARERSDWKACRAGLPVPFTTYHRNDQPAGVRDAAVGKDPVVLAETDGGFTVLLWPDDLERCEGSVEALATAIERAMADSDLDWPTV